MHISKLFYSKSTNSFWWLASGLCLYLADRPECDALLSLLGHGSATSKGFGHVATYKTTIILSCDLCYKSRVRHCQNGQPLRQCNNCTGWDIYDYPKASTYCELLHRYPTTQMSNLELPMHRTANEKHLVPH